MKICKIYKKSKERTKERKKVKLGEQGREFNVDAILSPISTVYA